MKGLKEILESRQAPKKAARHSERGDLMDFFMSRLKPYWNAKLYGQLTYPRLGAKLQGLDLRTLYFMKSYMMDLERDKGSEAAVKWFFWSLRNQKEAA